MALAKKLNFNRLLNLIIFPFILNLTNWNVYNSTVAQSIPTQNTSVDSLIISIFSGCTFQFLGNPKEFNPKIAIYASKYPARVDRFQFPVEVRRYGVEPQHDFPPKHLSIFARNHLFTTKLSHQCTVQLHFIDSSFHPTKFIQPLQLSAIGMIFYNENPHFVIYIMNRLRVSKQVAAAFLVNQWKSFPLSSIPLMTTSKSVYLLENILGGTVKLDRNSTLEQIKIRKRIASKNQMKQIFLVEGYSEWYDLGKYCGLLEVKLHTEYTKCTYHVLSTVYNFTAVNYAPWIENDIGRVSNGLATTDKIQFRFLGPLKNRGFQHHELIGYGLNSTEYRYIAFVKRNQGIDLVSMFLPFDLATAIVYAVASITFILILTTVIVNKIGECDDRNKSNIDFWKEAAKLGGFPFISILQQGDGRVIEKSRKTSLLAGFFLLFCWLYSCAIIGGEYSGHLYSTLTTAPTPGVPETVNDLVMGSDMTYITTSWHGYYQGSNQAQGYKPMRMSTLKELIQPEIIQGLSPEKRNSSLKIFLEKLRNEVKFVSQDTLCILQNVRKRRPIYTKEGKGKEDGSKQFAIINNKWDIDLAIYLGKQLLPNYYLYVSTENSRFTKLNSWYGKRTYFNGIFIKGLASLVESGIHERLFRHWNLLILIEQQKLVDEPGTTFYAMVTLANLNLKRQLIDGSETIRLESLAPIFICYGLFISLAGIVFILECGIRIGGYVMSCISAFVQKYHTMKRKGRNGSAIGSPTIRLKVLSQEVTKSDEKTEINCLQVR
ncbi:unnamed protein product [Orchesella dallaii]|uniref:Uncharacterized protein n=1 Tax=Orchesella dallaii TaxID=48710 RepID=A0ABP1PLF9_9HEXA